MSDPGPSRPPRRADGRRHLSDYLAVLRDHKVAAVVVFLLVIGAFAWRALRAEPVFEASALIQIDLTPSDTEPWMVWRTSYNLEAEIGVIRSHRVAEDAARDSGLYALILQRHAYRPLETFLAGYGFAHEHCRLLVETEPLPDASGSRWYVLRFDERGERFEAFDARENRRLLEAAFDPAGAAVTLEGHPLRIRVETGHPRGKTYDLGLHDLVEAGRWIQAGTGAALVKPYTPLVRVTFSGPTPHVARLAASALANSYVEEKTRLTSQKLTRRLEFLREQTAVAERNLAEAEARLDAYVVSEGAVLLSERASAVVADQARLRDQRLEQEELLREARLNLKELEEADSTERALALLETGRVDAKTTALATQLAEHEVERGALTRGGGRTAEDPRIRVIDVRMQEIQEQLERRVEALRQRAVESLRTRVAFLERRLARIDAEYERWDQELEALPREERQIAQLTRGVEAQAQALERLVTWEKEAELAAKSIRISAHVADEPLLPRTRASPNLSRQLMIGLLLGGFLALFAVFGLNAIDRSIRTPQALEVALGLPLFAAIPAYSSVRRRERRGLRTKLPAADLPHSVLAEAYRTLAANVRHAKTQTPIQALTIISASAQEGKTLTSLNLAAILAETDKRVVVVDADLRRPSTHRVLECPSTPGLTDFLTGKASAEDVCRKSRIPGVYLIPAGEPVGNPAALLDSEVFSRLLARLRKTFDHVIFDAAPVLAVTDAAAFVGQLDAVLLLARYGRGPIEALEGARDQIERLGGTVVGVILNAFDARRAERGGYGYHGYSGYYGRRYGNYSAPSPERPSRKRPAAGGEVEARQRTP